MVRGTGSSGLGAVIQRSKEERSGFALAVSQLASTDGKPTHLGELSINSDELLPPTLTANLRYSETFSASGLARAANEAERRRGAVGFSFYDVKLRHRELMRKRAAMSQGPRSEGEVAEDDGGEAGGGTAGGAVLETLNVQLERAERELAQKRLTQPPPRRLWYLLMLWCIGGYAGLHRIALGSRRVASAQVLSGILGIALVVLSDTLLHPRKIDAATYPFQEAYIVGGISYGFAGVSFLMWARDGYLLLRLRLRPKGHAALPRLGADGPAGRRQNQGGGGGAAASKRKRGGGESRAPRYSSLAQPEYRRLMLYWLFLGYPLSAHRWKLCHDSHASFQCSLNAIFLALYIVSDATVGTLATAYALVVGLGCALLAVPLVVWLRDLAQLLRGRLGPRKAAAPEWWLLLACTTLLGAFGGHRFLLRRRKSAWLFVMLTVLGGVLAIDAITGTSWSLVVASFDRGQAAAAAVRAKTRSVQGYAVPPPMPPSPVQTALESEEDDGGIGLRELGVRASEGLIGCSALLVMLVALGRDLNWLLHGKLVHQRESELYYNTIIAWVLGGIFGAHRWVASKSSWRIFIVLDVYAVVLLCVAEIYFKENLGDPTTDPSRFSVRSQYVTEAFAGLFMAAAFALWLSDVPSVLRGSLPYRKEQTLFWTALVGWLSPTGLLFGFHFWQFGRPLDWQLHSSLTTIGVLCGISARQFAEQGYPNLTYVTTLAAGFTCFGINVCRWLLDGFDLRLGGLLHRQLHDSVFRKLRLVWLLTGLLYSGHQWTRPEGATGLGYRIATFQTVLLHIFGVVLVLTAMVTVRPNGEDGARAAFGTLQLISIGCLGLLLVLWLRDGLRLALRRVDLRGERIEVLEEDESAASAAAGGAAGAVGGSDSWAEQLAAIRDEQEGVARPLTPPPTWRVFRTHLGTNYYFDPATEMVHYLANEGKGNYAVDPIYDVTVVYDSLAELEEQLERRGHPSYGERDERLTGAVSTPQGKAGASSTSSLNTGDILAAARSCRKRAAALAEQQV